ncbi:MAG: energy transducer TonB [Calditrichaeota bacterium]|nr:energy transducer TonB [Calditrichota bacterium]
MRNLSIIFFILLISSSGYGENLVDSLLVPDSLFAPPAWDGFSDVGSGPELVKDKCPQPQHPPEALKNGIKGFVLVGIHVDSSGHVAEWKILQEEPKGYGFAKAVEDVLPTWQFEPALQGNKPTSTWITIPFKFRLPKKD